MTRFVEFHDRILDIGELSQIEGRCRRTIRRMLLDGRLKNIGGDRARGTWLSDYLRAYGRHDEADALLRLADTDLSEDQSDARGGAVLQPDQRVMRAEEYQCSARLS